MTEAQGCMIAHEKLSRILSANSVVLFSILHFSFYITVDKSATNSKSENLTENSFHLLALYTCRVVDRIALSQDTTIGLNV